MIVAKNKLTVKTPFKGGYSKFKGGDYIVYNEVELSQNTLTLKGIAYIYDYKNYYMGYKDSSIQLKVDSKLYDKFYKEAINRRSEFINYIRFEFNDGDFTFEPLEVGSLLGFFEYKKGSHNRLFGESFIEITRILRANDFRNNTWELTMSCFSQKMIAILNYRRYKSA